MLAGAEAPAYTEAEAPAYTEAEGPAYTEAEARAYTQECELPVIGCCCPACGDLSLKRQRIKRLIAELELEHPDIKQSMIAALGGWCRVTCWI